MNSILKENIELQDTEMECLLSTFEAGDPHVSLEYDRNTRTGCFSVQTSLKNRRLYLSGINRRFSTRNDFLTVEEDGCTYSLTHLPPLNLHFILPVEYPGRPPNTFGPKIALTSVWLPKSILKQLCQQLNQLISENSGEMVLWLLVDALREENPAVYLNFEIGVSDGFTFDLLKFYDKYGGEMPLPFSICCELLVTHNDDQLDVEFQLGTWECPVCAEDYLGSRFFRFPICKHKCCKSCVQKAFIIAIEDGLMSSQIACLECGQDVGPHEARSVLPVEWYAKYEALTLNHGLNMMRDVVYCPRPDCKTVVILDDENLGRCPRCELAFCPHCFRTYHGTTRCPQTPIRKNTDTLTEEDLKRLTQEEEATKQFLEDEAKFCPGCSAPCLKSGGCNKMVCSFCRVFFCWLCGQAMTNQGDPYSHFRNGPCAGKLFEGLVPNDDEPF